MKTKIAEYLVNTADEYGFEAELREDYSGRNMFGKSTTGVVLGNDVSVLDLMVAVMQNAKYIPDDEDFMDDLESLKLNQDSMGMGTIIY